MRLFILFLLLAPFVAFSQTKPEIDGPQVDILSIEVISPKVNELPQVIQDCFEIGCYNYGCCTIRKIKHIEELTLGQFDLINKPREFWFFWDLIAVRD